MEGWGLHSIIEEGVSTVPAQEGSLLTLAGSEQKIPAAICVIAQGLF